jgi:CHAT domain-containing protein
MISGTRREKLWAGLGLLAIQAALLSRAIQPPAVSSPPLPGSVTKLERPLTPGVSIERSLPTGAIDVYRIPLRAGDFLHVLALQEGVDVSLKLIRPSGGEVLFVDSPNGDQFSESLFAVAEERGPYRLEIKAGGVSENRGHYRLELEKPRPALRADRLRAAAALAFARGEGQRRLKTLESRRAALRQYEIALRLWEQDGNREQQGQTLYRLGWIHDDLGELEAARGSYFQALRVLEGRGTAAVVSNRLGAAEAIAGRPNKARELYQRAIRTGDPVTQAGALNNLGILDRMQGEPQRAEEEIKSALALEGRIGLRSLRIKILTNQLWLYVELGDLPKALPIGTQILEIQRSLGDRAQEAETLLTMGFVCNRIGWWGAAFHYLRESAGTARKAGDARSLISALAEIGEMDIRAQDLQGARLVLGELLPLSANTADIVARANALTMVGRLQGALGERMEALQRIDQAEAVYRRLGDRNSVASVFKARAMILRDQGRLEEAREAIAESLRLIEELHSRPTERELRGSVLSSRSDYYALAVDVLMLLHQRSPNAGFDRQAFAASEQMRARVLLEELAEAQMARGVPPLSESRLTLDHPVELTGVQALLDGDTAVLAYSLGERKSFLWKIRNASVEAFELPSRSKIEEKVRIVYSLLIRPHPNRSIQQETARELADLGQALLSPLAPKLSEKHLIIVADEALRYVPFAALPEPAAGGKAGGEALVVRHALVSLPSVSLAALLRSEVRVRPSDDVSIAVFADPVFRSDDNRLASLVRTKTAEPKDEYERLERLSYSSKEADAIVKLVPPGAALEAVGFDASRERLMKPDLAGYRYLHIATHSLIKPRHPNRSGIILSGFNRHGIRVKGFLSSYQVYGLKLTADLVVLSACRTALDARLHGEGLSSLTRGFLYAGAKRVAASLWDVDDQATSVMMPIFYKALLRKGTPPADALREAQIEMMHTPRWAAPYYWAGFILHGDWH